MKYVSGARVIAHMSVSAIALSVCGGTALAQTETASEQTEQPVSGEDARVAVSTNTILVTGQKIERTLQDTEESVAITTAETIDERTLLEIDDVFLQSANVGSSFGGSDFSIRGITRNFYAAGGAGDLGVVYYDNVPLTGIFASASPRNLWDVSQIEIFRGPQSTNVGRNALAGAMVVRTFEPDTTGFDMAARAEYGNFETFAIEGMVNVPLSDIAAFRLTAERSESEGFLVNRTTCAEDAGLSKNTTVRGRFLIEPSDSFRALASLQYQDRTEGTKNYVLTIGEPLDLYQTSNNIPNRIDNELLIGSLDLEYQVSDALSIKSISAFMDADYSSSTDFDGTAVSLGEGFQVEDARNFSQELRVTYDSDRLRATAGVFYLDISSDGIFAPTTVLPTSELGVPAALLPFYPEFLLVDVNNVASSNTTNYAFFTQAEFDITDRLTLSAGFRYDKEKVSSDLSQNNVLDPSTPLPDPVEAGALADLLQPGLGPVVEAGVAQVNAILQASLVPSSESYETDFEAFLPELGLTYEASDDLKLSAFYKRGYRAGGARIGTTGELDTFDPEYLDNFEIAARTQWLDGTLVINANAYYGIWSDQQVDVPINGNQFDIDTQNAGKSNIWGFELEANFSPTRRTDLFASLGYAKTEFEEFCRTGIDAAFLDTCVTGGVTGVDLAGNDFRYSPDWSAAVGGRQFVTDRIFVQANVTYQDGSFSDFENHPQFENDGFTLLNASAGYRGDNFDLTVYGRNLTEAFATSWIGPGDRPNQIFVTPAVAPREYGVILTARY
ncbi:TonB-dependent receptor [Aurantiacibacter suaedae]|uniref:TonB-dependent receptor n=1 Tax=Aurantiacibacter suaedae TaxID=2545755 RepID=UPI0013868292|nr:TonB-dependent receptor [Aurantiacibacter suaedae]